MSIACHHNVRFGRGSTSAPPPKSTPLSPPICPKKKLLTLNEYFIFERCSAPRESLDVAKVLAECRLGAHEYGEQMERFLFSD